jgi:NAD(P)-dependent dehydrogenase (short-subunit alcohol dehydrogenase family)
VKGQTVLVTGGTAGIGFYTARGLAARGARVLITGRDPDRGQRALQELRRAAAGRGELLFMAADHATVGGNQRLAQRVRDHVHRLDVLVNNVGGFPAARQQTPDAYEETLALNALGPFALTRALLPVLQAAGKSRVVNVISGAHALWRGDPFGDLHSTESYVGIRALARAKLLGLFWSLALARRPESRHVTVNATNPGRFWTPGTQALAGGVPAWRIAWPFVRFIRRWASPERAARCSIHLAACPELAGVTGEYFEGTGRPVTPCAAARDPVNQDRAWRVLSDLVERAPTALEHGVRTIVPVARRSPLTWL